MTKKKVKLTAAQDELLRLCMARPQRVVRGYKPAIALERLGFVSTELVDPESKISFQIKVTITEAGQRHHKGQK